jgi:hypothetical protein
VAFAENVRVGGVLDFFMQNRSKKLVVVALLISLSSFTGAAAGDYHQRPRFEFQSSAFINDQDLAEIVQAVIGHAIAHPVTTFSISRTESVSSENMKGSMLPKIAGYEFELVDPGKIEERANSSGNMRYLVFSVMKARHGEVKLQVCRVSLSTCWGQFSSSNCFIGDYRKESGLWKGELRPTLSTVVKPAPRR